MLKHHCSEIKDEIDFENKETIFFKPVVVQVDFNGQKQLFSLRKRVIKNDDWRIYYVISKDKSIGIEFNDPKTPPLVRIDSGCVSGQIYGDETCDCIDQLHRALYQISQDTNNSLLIHIPAQDGRGYGTAPKGETEIYKQGGRGRLNFTQPLDTVSGAKLLYSPGLYDIRTFDGAAKILKEIGLKKVVLLTNNISKLKALKKYDIEVIRKGLEIEKPSCAKHLECKKNSLLYY